MSEPVIGAISLFTHLFSVFSVPLWYVFSVYATQMADGFPAQQMHMNMEYFLAAVEVGIENEPKAASVYTLVFRDLCRGLEHFGEDLRRMFGHFDGGGVVLFRNDQHMYGGNGMDIRECDDILSLKNDV